MTSLSRTDLLQVSGGTTGHDLSWLTFVAFAALLIGGEWRVRTTPGTMLLGLRVIAAQDPERRSVPLKQIAIRYGVAIAGVLLPVSAAFALILFPVMWGGTPSEPSLIVGMALVSVSAAWQIWNDVRIVRRLAAVYDDIAGVEAIRVLRRPAVASVSPETSRRL